MPVIRTVHQVPYPGAPNGRLGITPDPDTVAITETLHTLEYEYSNTPGGGYLVVTPNDGVTPFNPGERMLFCESGVYKVRPVAAENLKPGDGILGFATGRDSDIFDAVMVLRHTPQVCGSTVRLVPDPDRCFPAPYVFGVVYGPLNRPAWKLV